MDVKHRSVLVAREIGCERAHLKTFCCTIDMPMPPHDAAASFRTRVNSVHHSVKRCSKSMDQTGNETRQWTGCSTVEFPPLWPAGD